MKHTACADSSGSASRGLVGHLKEAMINLGLLRLQDASSDITTEANCLLKLGANRGGFGSFCKFLDLNTKIINEE